MIRIDLSPGYVNDYKLTGLFNLEKNIDDFYTLKVSKADWKMYKRKTNGNYIEKVNEYYSSKIDTIENQKNIINNLQENLKNKNKEIDALNNELTKLTKDYNDIVNSKRWKAINKLMRLFGK